MGTRATLYAVAKGKYLFPTWESNPGRPADGHSVYFCPSVSMYRLQNYSNFGTWSLY